MSDRETRISKTMAYLLRHDPEGMDMDSEGFVPLQQLLERLNQRGLNVDAEDVEKVVRNDPKGRYELSDGRTRARYGHSVDVEPDLEPQDLPDLLYHGTSPDAAEKILRDGLRSRNRQKVHLSGTVETARSVGARHHPHPVILDIDCRAACETGVHIEKAATDIYVADDIPSEAIKRHAGSG